MEPGNCRGALSLSVTLLLAGLLAFGNQLCSCDLDVWRLYVLPAGRAIHRPGAHGISVAHMVAIARSEV